MQIFEQVKLFSGSTIKEVESQFNSWVRDEAKVRSSVPILSNQPFTIRDRRLTVQSGEKNLSVVLAIFYDYTELSSAEVGSDKMRNDIDGFSAVPKQVSRRSGARQR